MRTIAVVKVDWHNKYCSEGYLTDAHPIFQEVGLSWKDVEEDEFIDIELFVKSTKSRYDNLPQYVVVEKVDQVVFYKAFEEWKEKIKKDKEKLEKAREKRLLAEKDKEKRNKQKKIEKAKKLLEAAGILK
jgi:hypothetical protein